MVERTEFERLLERLERAWERLDAPILDMLRPGLSDSQIDELVAPTGLTLPDELRWWWRWHDSALRTEPDFDEGRQVSPGGWLHLPLSAAVDSYDYHDGLYREMLAIGATDIADLSWRPGLFPFTHRVWKPNHVLVADTVVAEHAPAPVVLISDMGIEHWAGADSVADAVGIWVELLESGRYLVGDNGSWQPVDEMLVEDERARRVL